MHDGPSDHLLEQREIQVFGKVIVGAGFHRPYYLGYFSNHCEDNHLDRGIEVVHLLEKIQTVVVRELEIEQEYVHSLSGQDVP